jgi:hypothetical protein
MEIEIQGVGCKRKAKGIKKGYRVQGARNRGRANGERLTAKGGR